MTVDELALAEVGEDRVEIAVTRVDAEQPVARHWNRVTAAFRLGESDQGSQP